MNCKKCGCDTLLNDGEWLICPVCGAEYYNIDAEYAKIITAKEQEKFEKQSTSEHNASFTERQTESREPSGLKKEPVFASKPQAEKTVTPKEAEKTQPETEKETEISEKSRYANQKEAAFPPISQEPEIIDDFLEHSEDASPVKETDFTDNPDAFFLNEETNDEEFPVDKEPSEFTEEEYAYHENRKHRRQNKKKEKKKSKLRDVVEFLFPIVMAIILAFILKTFVIANAYVPTGSMTPTINAKENIIASRLAYKSNSPKRYDIVLFYYPDDEEQLFVKRILASSGETLTVTDGVVYVTTKDGKSFQPDRSFVNSAEEPRGNFGPYYVPEKGEVITEQGGLCYAENGLAVGNSEFISKYCVKDGSGNYVIAENLYFMMGDNRNTSLDSRSWKFTYVAEDKIVGKVLFKYWPKFEKLS